MTAAHPVVWLADVDTESEHFGASSKHLARLMQAKFPLVPGFVITTNSYQNFLQENNLEHKIRQILSTISFERPDSLMQAEFHIKQLFQKADLSDAFYDLLQDFYLRLGDEVVIEMHETGKHGRKHAQKIVTSDAGLISEVIQVWSEMFTGKALWHRHHGKINHFDNKAEIIVRKNSKGEKTGKIFTVDPHTHVKDKLVIVTEYPHERDTYVLSKRNLTILDRNLKHQHHGDKLTLDEILAIAKLAKRVEEHLYFPQEISWALTNNLLTIEAIAPITEIIPVKKAVKPRLPIARGKGLTPRIGTGTAFIINSQTLPSVTSHHVVVISDIKPQQVKQLKKIKGLIIESHPHGEIISLIRHYGIPAICDVKQATKRFRNGHIVSINGVKGEIYQGGYI